jgi:hypothetical protein
LPPPIKIVNNLRCIPDGHINRGKGGAQVFPALCQIALCKQYISSTFKNRQVAAVSAPEAGIQECAGFPGIVHAPLLFDERLPGGLISA